MFGWMKRLLAWYFQMLMRLVVNRRGAIANQVAGILMALFLLGAVGGTAVVLASNVSLYAGAPPVVILLWCTAIPVMAGVAVMMYFLPRRG